MKDFMPSGCRGSGYGHPGSALTDLRRPVAVSVSVAERNADRCDRTLQASDRRHGRRHLHFRLRARDPHRHAGGPRNQTARAAAMVGTWPRTDPAARRPAGPKRNRRQEERWTARGTLTRLQSPPRRLSRDGDARGPPQREPEGRRRVDAQLLHRLDAPGRPRP